MFATTKLLKSTTSPAGSAAAWRLRLVAALGALLAVGGGVVGWFALRPAAAVRASSFGALTALDPGAPALALVFVSGAVVRPGLYHLSPDARIADALAAAGGLTAQADLGRLPNLAARIHDAHQVNVPFLRGTGTGASTYSGRLPWAQRLDINTASLDELLAVPGMPLGLAQAIVDYRTQFGPFRAMSDLRIQLGIDGPTVTGLRLYLRVVPVSP
jgi:competence protein ComEA